VAIRNFLIVYNWRKSQLDHWRDIDRDVRSRMLTPDRARNLYREYEQRFPQSDGYEVVLVGADSLDTLKKTHSHYFGDIETDPFTELLESKPSDSSDDEVSPPAG
jgi:hypothetical protein